MTKKIGRRKVGRPTDYTEQLGQEICERLLRGELGVDICQLDHMPDWSTIWRWQEKHEEFRKAYIRAREIQQYWFVDHMRKRARDESRDYYTDDKGIRRSDNTAVQRDKLIVETDFKLATKLAATVFGDKVKQEISGPEGSAIQYQQLVDKPPKETPEEWQLRVQNQLMERAKSRES